MSGENHQEICPECGGSLEVYTDWKPYTTASGECIDCGFMYFTQEGHLEIDELIDRRMDWNWKEEEYNEYAKKTKDHLCYVDWVRKETEKQFVIKKLEGKDGT